MQNSNDIQDVVVIGGGPAGSTTATRLAQNGYRVTLLEKEKFPRIHVGESLLPFCYPLFQQLGVLDQLEQNFVRKPSVRFMSIDGKDSTIWCFNHIIDDDSHLSFHVDRKRFDHLLLNNARKHGVTVHEETKVREVEFEADGVKVVSLGPNGKEQVHQARYLVDASGRSTFMASKNRWRKPYTEFERTALWTHWKTSHPLKGGLEEGAAIIVYLGQEKRGWAWIFPLTKDYLTIGVVLDSAYLREQKRSIITNNGTDWQTSIYMQELHTSDFIKDIIAGAEISTPLQVEGDYSYHSENKFGKGYLLVGDAGHFIDPVFSSGVYLSLKSSFLVAEALHEMFESGDLDNLAPMEKAYEKINGAYGLIYRVVKLFYNPHAVSFAEAGSVLSGNQHQEHEDVLAAAHYVLAGDFFEENGKYHRHFDLLENPKAFNVYRKFVIKRDSFEAQSCNVDPAVVFPEQTLDTI